MNAPVRIDDAPASGHVDVEATGGADLRALLHAEAAAMLRYAWSRGLGLQPEILAALPGLYEGAFPVAATDAWDRPGARVPLVQLALLHARLASVIAPAMPLTVRLLEEHSGDRGWATLGGPIPNVRRLLLTAFGMIVMFVLVSTSSSLNAETMTGDIYSLDGPRQIVAMTFLLVAAGIGGTFQALFTAQRYVANATYDPRYDGSYWIRIALGLVAGLLLSELVPVHLDAAESPTLTKPVLALLGGFSSGLVHRLLQRLVDTIESLFQARAPSP